MNEIDQKVWQFYQATPFNLAASLDRQRELVCNSNQIKSDLPDLDNLLSSGKVVSVLDLGCGVGWLSCTLKKYYPSLQVTGLDFSSRSLSFAKDMANSLKLNVDFIERDILGLEKELGYFDLIISLGVLHHLNSIDEGIQAATKVMNPKASYLYLGLYHTYGRAPFMNLVKEFKDYQQFMGHWHTSPFLGDNSLAESWFRDQAKHPRETCLTFKELRALLLKYEMSPLSTSINRYQKISQLEALYSEEAEFLKVSFDRNIIERNFFPGFFTTLAGRGTATEEMVYQEG